MVPLQPDPLTGAAVQRSRTGWPIMRA
jgi:hypothetical protein